MFLHPTEPLQPKSDKVIHLIAARFADTWTKLRVFQLHETYPQFERIVYLDADMLVFKSPDPVFSIAMPSDHIAANHACVCNLDSDPWAPADWTKENCAYTPISHPGALTAPTPVTPTSRPTHQLLNSGFFVFSPSATLWSSMLDFFNTTPLLAGFKFPDQDFLAEFFRGRWRSVGWQYNALKTMRYWHPNIWRDDQVVVIHYIVDKPWAKRVADDGTAGYKGRDGTTHKWWWDLWDEWKRERRAAGDAELAALVEEQTDTGKELSKDMKDIGVEVQALATNGKKTAMVVEQEEGQGDMQGSPEPVEPTPKRQVLGERGQGPKVKGGESYMPP